MLMLISPRFDQLLRDEDHQPVDPVDLGKIAAQPDADVARRVSGLAQRRKPRRRPRFVLLPM